MSHSAHPRLTLAPSAGLLEVWAARTLNGLYLLRDGAFEWVNPQCARATGYAPDALVGRPALTLVHPEDQAAVRTAAVAMLNGERTTPYEYRFLTAQGEVRWALETVVAVPDPHHRLTFGSFLDITEHMTLEAQLRHDVLHDPLTGVANRVLLLERLRIALRQPSAGVAILCCDLDDFKAVNDRLGHLGGDALLVAICQRLEPLLGAGDLLARFGGDEFVLLLVDRPDAEAVGRMAGTLMAALEEPFRVLGQCIQVSVSMGYALASQPDMAPMDLLRAADLALYCAKGQGKGRAVLALS
jgi:diguanylate cyclase (GGDEF)-like protein/PAS domain S-box-containing protein